MGERPKRISDKDLLEHFGVELGTGAQEDQEKDEVKKRATHGISKPREAAPSEPPIDLDKVIFTTHALDQFVKRFREAQPKSKFQDPCATALKILATATETKAIGRTHKMRRLIKHQFEEVRYFINSGWRFVVKEADGKFLVVTIERAQKS